MGGSFESGAGDDPDELFADESGSEEESRDEEEIETDTDTETTQEQPAEATEATTPDTSVESREDSRPATTATASTETDESEGEEQRETPVMLEVDTPEDLDVAHLAREFVPDTYEKPHAWALGRGGVNDGRSEKKTFFLQSSVLDLETACSQEVNEILDGDVPLTDLRELALILAYHQPELLAEAAREWGAESA